MPICMKIISLESSLFHVEARRETDTHDETTDHIIRDDPCSIDERVCRGTVDLCL